MISGKALFERSDDRDRTGNGSLKLDIASIIFRKCQDLLSVLREHILVCRDNLFSYLKRLHDISSRRLHAAHQFDDQLDFIIFQDFLPVVRQDLLRDSRALFFCVPHQDLLDLQISSRFLKHLIL